MSHIDALNQRYAASASLVRNGVEILAVGDPHGARFNLAIRRLMALVRDDGGPFLDDLIGAAKALRWRQITQPQRVELNPSFRHLASEVTKHAEHLRGAISDQALLDELAFSASELANTNSEVGSALLRSIDEVGAENCVVVAASRPAATGLEAWLRDHRVPVLTAGDLERDRPEREQAYVIAPPIFYRSSLVTAPVTEAVSFLVPAWFGDRSLPRSVIAPYAEGSVRVEARVFVEGDTSELVTHLLDDSEDEDEYLPQPAWGNRPDSDRDPTGEEVEARRLILSGNLAMWLDDGDRIRSLDPDQPPGERVTYTDVPAVRPGTYLLLRQGETERSALYKAAIARLSRGDAVDHAQVAWKHQLADRIHQVGYGQATRQLRDTGVKTADRARAWIDPNLIRPASDQDFERLLLWLGIPVQPTFGYATVLRRALYQVSAEIGKQLEAAVSAADLSELAAAGHLGLDIKTEGFRGILATRVLAVSPFTGIVPRHHARVLFEERGGRWLE